MPPPSVTLDADELDDLDRAILDYLQEGKSSEQPWGVATPAVVQEALRNRGYEGVPVRQTINNHMKKLQHAGHLRNRFGKGEYEFVSDPRDGNSNNELS